MSDLQNHCPHNHEMSEQKNDCWHGEMSDLQNLCSINVHTIRWMSCRTTDDTMVTALSCRQLMIVRWVTCKTSDNRMVRWVGCRTTANTIVSCRTTADRMVRRVSCRTTTDMVVRKLWVAMNMGEEQPQISGTQPVTSQAKILQIHTVRKIPNICTIMDKHTQYQMNTNCIYIFHIGFCILLKLK
jgi:hypothetical protein